MTLERLLKGAKRYAENPRERRALRTGSIEFDAHRLQRICALLAGNTCVFARDLNPSSIVALCANAEVSLIHLNAYKLASLAHAATSECRLPSCTGILSGGSRVPGALRHRVKAFLTEELWVLYATSETGMISRANPDEHELFPEGVGYPAPDVTFEILGRSGKPVRPGEIGRIRVHKSTMAKGYVLEPAGVASHYQDGWFNPGDLISQEEGEPLVFHGRADDVMILNGINIFPSAIEDTLESHPDVREAIAYPVKSRIHGDIPVAAVVMQGQRQANPVELLNYCRQSLGVRAPRQIRIVESIPRNTGGKPLRGQMAES
jgi:acyl-coenzyme A synthetase/AMP-(fatty) acid ligase